MPTAYLQMDKRKNIANSNNLYMMHRVFGMHMEDMLVARDVGKD